MPAFFWYSDFWQLQNNLMTFLCSKLLIFKNKLYQFNLAHLLAAIEIGDLTEIFQAIQLDPPQRGSFLNLSI